MSSRSVVGLVINLDNRTDRLSSFQGHVAARLPDVTFTRISAVNGRELILDDALLGRIDPRNFIPGTDSQMRGNVGCTLSHIKAWRVAQCVQERHVLVFEDDARFVSGSAMRHFARAIRRVPEHADLVFLNEYNRTDWRAALIRGLSGASRTGSHGELIGGRGRQLASAESFLAMNLNAIVFRPWEATHLKTTEAYLISPRFARALADRLQDWLGAVDEHIRVFVQAEGAKAFEMIPALFRQADRSDSNIL
jgi:GR25 family glycosyltransferase involved in LPS biosynthesis